MLYAKSYPLCDSSSAVSHHVTKQLAAGQQQQSRSFGSDAPAPQFLTLDDAARLLTDLAAFHDKKPATARHFASFAQQSLSLPEVSTKALESVYGTLIDGW